jgi:hypothetical protein
MSLMTMSEAQRENLSNIIPMPVGVWRCRDAGNEERNDCCGHVELWEAPLEDGFEPKCPDCLRPALLVDEVPRP